MQKREGRGWIQECVEEYPEILQERPSEPRKILFEFCYQQRTAILENSQFAEMVTSTVEFLQDMDYYEEGRPGREELKGNLQLLVMKRLAGWQRRVAD